MKLRSSPIDDIHLELLMQLDEVGSHQWWAQLIRAAANAVYRRHRDALLWLMQVHHCSARRSFLHRRSWSLMKED